MEINNLYSLEEYIGYRKKLRDTVSERKTDIFFNDSAIHTVLTLTAMLDNCSMINIYCDRFLFFREEYRKKVQGMLQLMSDKDRKEMAENGFAPMEVFSVSLKAFFERGGKMNVVIERELDLVITDTIWPQIKEYAVKGHLTFFVKEEPSPDNYYYITGNNRFYRKDNTRDVGTAFYSCNDPDTVEALQKNFAILLAGSHQKEF